MSAHITLFELKPHAAYTLTLCKRIPPLGNPTVMCNKCVFQLSLLVILCWNLHFCRAHNFQFDVPTHTNE